MDPRTATAKDSIWRSVTENLFQEHIGVLWKLTSGRAKDPMTYAVPSSLESSECGLLPLTVEVDLARGFAFVSASGIGTEYVSAAAIEIPSSPEDGLRLNIASNCEIRPHVKERLSEVVLGMRAIAAEELTRDQCKDRVLEAILKLNRARIHARLKPRKGSRPIVLEGLQKILQDVENIDTQTDDLETLATRLRTLCEFLRRYHQQLNQSQNIDHTKNLVVACHNFFSVTKGSSIKCMLLCAGVDIDVARGNPHIRQIGKVAAYYHIAEMLVTVASRRAFRRLFLNISVQYAHAYRSVQSLIVPAPDGGSGSCRVHAEVQLVVEFDTRKSSVWSKPRAIGSSKAACFLCELFINKHGDYFVPECHGKLTPRWTIPDLDDFSTPQVNRYRGIIHAMDQELRRLAKTPHPKRVDPAMSWQALSQLNALPNFPSYSGTIRSKLSFTKNASAASVEPKFEEDGSKISAVLPQPKMDSIAINPLLGPLVTETSCTSQKSIHTPDLVGKQITNHLDYRGDYEESNSQEDVLVANKPYLGDQCAVIDSEIPAYHSPEQKQPTQVRPFMNLDCKKQLQTAHAIRGHESRTCNMPCECDMSATRQPSLVADMSHCMSRRIDFHDLELFFENEYPATAQISIATCSNPDTSRSELVVDIDKLSTGEEVVVDVGTDINRVVYLTKKGRPGIERWWKICWSSVARSQGGNL